MKYTIVRQLSKLALIGMDDEVLAVHPEHLAERFSSAGAHPVKTFTVTPHSDAVTQERMDRAAVRAFGAFAEAYN